MASSVLGVLSTTRNIPSNGRVNGSIENGYTISIMSKQPIARARIHQLAHFSIRAKDPARSAHNTPGVTRIEQCNTSYKRTIKHGQPFSL